MCEFTDHCFTPPEILQWEILLLSKLDWCLRPESPIAFADNILKTIGMYRQLKPKVVDMLTMSTADPEMSAVAVDCLAVAAVEIILEETKSNAVIPPNFAHIDSGKVVQKLKSIIEDDADSDYGSSLGSVVSVDFDNYFKDFKSISSFSQDMLSYRVSNL